MSIKERFVTRFDKLLKAGEIKCVGRAVEVGHDGMPSDASLTEHARFIVCLEGVAHYMYKRGQDTETIQLNVGEGIFVAHGRWVRASPSRTYNAMGVIFHPELTRFYMTRSSKKQGKRWGVHIVETCIIPAFLSEDKRSLLRLLTSSGPAAEAGRFHQAIFEGLFISTRDLLVRDPDSEAGKAHFTWQAACHYIAENLHRPLGRKDLAAHLRIHPNHVSRLFTKFSGESFALYIQNQRLARARLLMDDPLLNVSEIARLSGFSSANYFIRVFRSHFGTTPTKAR